MEKLDHDIFGTQGLDDDDGVFEQDRENGEEGRVEGGAEDLGGGEDGEETVQGSQETEGGEEEEDEESESDDDIQIHIGPIETPATPFYQGRLPSTSSMLANVSYTTHSSLVGGMRLSSNLHSILSHPYFSFPLSRHSSDWPEESRCRGSSHYWWAESLRD